MDHHNRLLAALALASALVMVTAGTTRSWASPSGGVWLDAKQIHNWNKIAETIPKAPAPVGDPATSGRCAETVRPATTPEDRALTAAGWKLFRPYELFAGTSLVAAMASVDGMCRPLQFNIFVFSNARFGGTLSPVLMNSRTDGALSETYLDGSSHLMATYTRYRDQDPLCCPSRITALEYSLISSHAVPLILPMQASTNPTGSQ